MKLTLPQVMALDAVVALRATTSAGVGTTDACFRSLARKGLVKNDGPNIKGRSVWRATEKGEKVAGQFALSYSPPWSKMAAAEELKIYPKKPASSMAVLGPVTENDYGK